MTTDSFLEHGSGPDSSSPEAAEQVSAVRTALSAASPPVSLQLRLIRRPLDRTYLVAALIAAAPTKESVVRVVSALHAAWPRSIPLADCGASDLSEMLATPDDAVASAMILPSLPLVPRHPHWGGVTQVPTWGLSGISSLLPSLMASADDITAILHVQTLDPESPLATGASRRVAKMRAGLEELTGVSENAGAAPNSETLARELTDQAGSIGSKPTIFAATVVGRAAAVSRVAPALASALHGSEGWPTASMGALDSIDAVSQSILVCSELANEDLIESSEVGFGTMEKCASLLTLPEGGGTGSHGLRLRRSDDVTEGALPTGTARSIFIGTTRSKQLVNIEVDDLAQHSLIVGNSGMGKTTTVKSILRRLWVEFEIPFLIIEPAKEEYQGWTLDGDGTAPVEIEIGSDQRWNPLAVPPGADRASHIGRVLNALDAAYKFSEVNPYGWVRLRDITLDAFDLSDPEFPTFTDLYRLLAEELVSKVRGGQQDAANWLQFVLDRLKQIIRIGAAGSISLDPSAAIDWPELLSKPTLISLGRITEYHDRAFVLSLLIGELISFREGQRRAGTQLRQRTEHLVVVEEAHRVLGVTSGGEGAQAIAQGIAELRSAGQGFMIADQSPASLIPEVLRSAGIKIIHRVGDSGDASHLAASVGMPAVESNLTTLDRGEALILVPSWRRPAFVQIDPDTSELVKVNSGIAGRLAVRGEGTEVGFACDYCPSPCRGRHQRDLGESLPDGLEPDQVVGLLTKEVAPQKSSPRWAEVFCGATLYFSGRGLRGRDYRARMREVRGSIDDANAHMES